MPKYDKHKPSPIHSIEHIEKCCPKEIKDKLNDVDTMQHFFEIYGNDPDRIFKKDYIRNIQIRCMYDTLRLYTDTKYGTILKSIALGFDLSIPRIKNILSEFKAFGLTTKEDAKKYKNILVEMFKELGK